MLVTNITIVCLSLLFNKVYQSFDYDSNLNLSALSTPETPPPPKRPDVKAHIYRWECPGCGNSNGDWTSICGRCGRSRPD